MSGSNFNHTVITSDGAALIRRSKEENKKIVFVKAVSSLKFENLRGDLVHKSREWFESIEGSVIAVQAVDGVFKLAVSFSQAPSKVTLKSIGILAKLAGETDAQAVVFSAASDDNSQLVVDTTSAVVAFVEDLPAAINASNTDSYGTIPQGGGGGGGGDISGCVASGVYDSTNHNILLKNNVGTVLSTIDCSAFIVDGMVEDVEIENGYLVISFNTDAGKQDISIPLTDIFNPANYYTRTQVDSGFMTTSTDQLTLTGCKKWPYHWGNTDTALELKGGETPWVRLSNTEETNTTRTDNLIDVYGGPNSQITVDRSIADITDPDQPTQHYTVSLKPDILDVRSTFPDDSYIHTEIIGGSIVLEDTNGLEPFQASIDSDGFYAGDPGSANEVILKRAIGGLNVNATIGGVQRQISLTLSNGLSLDGKVLANDSVGFKHQDQSTGAYASLDATDGLKILGATGTTLRQIDKMGLLMGNLRVYWSDVPVQFKTNNDAYEVLTYGSQATTSRIKKTYITQVYVYEENATLKCSSQFEGGTWSAYTAMNASTPKDIVSNRLRLIFDNSSKLTAIRLVGSISLSTLCTFKLLVPQSGSYSMIHGMLYVEPGTVNTADYTLSTPVELSDGDLLICEAEFMPCSFTSPVPEPDPAP